MTMNELRRRRCDRVDHFSRRLLHVSLLGGLIGCVFSTSAWSQTDPTTNRPDFREPAELSLHPSAPVRLRAMYDDRVEQTLRRKIDGSMEVLSHSVIRQSFGHTFPSGTIRVNPGSTLAVDFTNNLSFTANQIITGGKDGDSTKQLLLKQRNITNLHTHGLHVSPKEFSDNVLLHVNEKKHASYRIKLPGYHAPGTHWYHSHVHGSTALQVSEGMLGALIVNEPDGQQLTPKAYQSVTTEHVVVITQATGNPNPQQQALQMANKGVALNLDPKIASLLKGQVAQGKRSRLTDQLQKLINVDDEQQFHSFVDSLNEQDSLDELLAALHNLRRQEPTFMVNGQLNPVLELDLGDVFRLRIVNAGANNGDYKSLFIEKDGSDDVPMYLAAMDGVNLTHLPTVDGVAGNYIAYTKTFPLDLAPSNRADVYFMAQGAGTYTLKHNSQVILTIEVSEPGFILKPFDQAAHGMRLRTFLNALNTNLKQLQKTPPYAKDGYLHRFNTGPNPRVADSVPVITRSMTFNVAGRGAEDPPKPNSRKFTINSRDYNEMVVVNGKKQMQGKSDYLGRVAGDGGLGPDGVTTPWPIRVGTVEQWEITNTTPTSYPNSRHPFHIHVNPFWVVDITEDNGKTSVRKKNPYDPRLNRWQDTINIPGGEKVTIRHRFSEFDGVFVLHCHILNHEDRGMMINTMIVPNLEPNPAAYFKAQMDRNAELNQQINGTP